MTNLIKELLWMESVYTDHPEEIAPEAFQQWEALVREFREWRSSTHGLHKLMHARMTRKLA